MMLLDLGRCLADGICGFHKFGNLADYCKLRVERQDLNARLTSMMYAEIQCPRPTESQIPI